jgi:DNA-binding transcriptional ArsR family regulator
MDDARMDAVFAALAHPSRRRMLDILKHRPGCSVQHVAQHFAMSRIAVMKHLSVLADAGLVLSEKHGRTRALYFNPVPIQEIHERWTTEFSALWAAKLTRIQRAVESRTTHDE